MDNSETNFLAPILSAIAGFGAIIAALSPLFGQSRLSKLFVDTVSAGFWALVAFLISVISLWMFSSQAISLMISKTGIDLARLAGARVKLFALFVFSVIAFYAVRLLWRDRQLSFSWAAFLQAIAYLLAFFSLSAAIGMQFRDTFDIYKWRKNEESRPAKIREKLIDNGLVSVDLKIISIQTLIQKPEYPPNWQNAYFVIYETKEGRFKAFVDSNTGNILNHEPDTIELSADLDGSHTHVNDPTESEAAPHS